MHTSTICIFFLPVKYLVTQRKSMSLQQLKRVFKKLDHDVNVEEYTR